MKIREVFAALLLVAVAAAVTAAHQSKVVGPYRLSVGMRVEPAYTDERNGLDLIVRRAADRQPVEGLEDSLQVELTAPNGQQRRYSLKPKPGEPGRYTTEWVLTQPGVYRIRVFGRVNGQPIDETFESHEVHALSELRFPADGPGKGSPQASAVDVKGQAAAVEVKGAWARPAAAVGMGQGHASHEPASATGATSAVYMTLVNDGDRPLKLVAVRTAAARTAELHQTRIEGQIARMVPVRSIDIPPHGRVELAPGGLHVMLIGLTRDLKAGDRFPLTLVFDDGSERAVEVEVRQG